MLTTTETITRPLTPFEQLSLDTQKCCESYAEHMVAGNKAEALAYAKVLMLKAFALGRNWEIALFQFFEFFRNLEYLNFKISEFF